MLDVVGNNLANLNTTGFKAQDVNFQRPRLSDNATGAVSANSSGRAPTPNKSAMGVTTSLSTDRVSREPDDHRQSPRPGDPGNGAFVVNDGTQNFYTRSGPFNVDQNGFLVDPTTVDLVQRFGTIGEASATSPAFQTAGTTDIQIPNGAGIPGKATPT